MSDNPQLDSAQETGNLMLKIFIFTEILRLYD